MADGHASRKNASASFLSNKFAFLCRRQLLLFKNNSFLLFPKTLFKTFNFHTILAKNYQTTLKIALKPPSPITMLDRLDSTAHIILLIKSQHFSLNLNIKFGGKGGNTAGLDIFWPRL